jgi:phosphoglycolate phosphatase-like HAD superfamily hydrolase
MRTHISRTCCVLAPVVTLALAGCGADQRLSKSDYEQKVRAEYADVQDAFRATGAAYGQPGLADKIKEAQAQLREAADALAEAEPPQKVEKENEEIVEGMREYADDLDQLRDAAEKGDLRSIAGFNDRIAKNEAVEQIAEAAEEMKFKGYDLGQISEE